MEIDLQMIVRLLLASLLGGLIGLEREIHGRPAGFRTHLLVSLGSCLFVATSIEFYKVYGNFSGNGPVGVDPGRVAAQVVTGIGFLGAGAIIREKASIRGLTTAACLWMAAAIGVACGTGLIMIAMVVTAIAILNLLLLKKVEYRLKRDTYSTIKVWSEDLDGQMARLIQLLVQCQLQVVKTGVDKDMVIGEIFFDFEVKSSARQMSCDVVERIVATAGVKKVRLE